MREPEPGDRIVTVESSQGSWRVCAAHMEPLRFATAEDAERAGRRVARTLCRLGFDTRLEIYDDAGALTNTARFSAETSLIEAPAARRALH